MNTGITFKWFKTVIIYKGQPIGVEVVYDNRFNIMSVVYRQEFDVLDELSEDQVHDLAVKARQHAHVRAA